MNNSFDVIIVAGGLSTRMGFDKLSAFLGEQTVLSRTLQPFLTLSYVNKIIVVSDKKYDFPDKVVFAPAGKTRTLSVLSGLSQVTSPFVMIHDGARPFVSVALIDRLCHEAKKKDSAVPYLPATDTLRKKSRSGYELCDRNDYILLQTPQVFVTEKIKECYLEPTEETDDSALFSKRFGDCNYVEGDFANKKITRPEDIFGANALIGTGFDLHRLVPEKKLRLCGVTIPYPLGEEAHSDGDAPIHALMDALLTAAGMPDIGHLFPDTDPAYKDIDSTLLLAEVKKKIDGMNRRILSVDLAILLEKPKISPYLLQMKEVFSSLLDIAPEKVNISATTTEKIGLIGENKAVAALCVVSLL